VFQYGFATVVKSVDTTDLKSVALNRRAGSIPASRTRSFLERGSDMKSSKS